MKYTTSSDCTNRKGKRIMNIIEFLRKDIFLFGYAYEKESQPENFNIDI